MTERARNIDILLGSIVSIIHPFPGYDVPATINGEPRSLIMAEMQSGVFFFERTPGGFATARLGRAKGVLIEHLESELERALPRLVPKDRIREARSAVNALLVARAERSRLTLLVEALQDLDAFQARYAREISP